MKKDTAKAKTKDEMTFVRLDAETRRELETRAEKDRRPLSTYIRMVLEDHVRSKVKAKDA